MGLEFTGVDIQHINFGNMSTMQNITNDTWIVTFGPVTVADDGVGHIIGGVDDIVGTGQRVWLYLSNVAGTYYFEFWSDWTSHPYWAITFNPAITNQIVITYNNSSTANDPVIYLNGVSQSVTEWVAPSGTVTTPTSSFVAFLGDDIVRLVSWPSITGILYSILRYNRILTAADVTSLYSAGLTGPNTWAWAQQNPTGLLFMPNLNMAQGVTRPNFAGTSLGASNYIVDCITCTTGTPTGSPIGR